MRHATSRCTKPHCTATHGARGARAFGYLGIYTHGMTCAFDTMRINAKVTQCALHILAIVYSKLSSKLTVAHCNIYCSTCATASVALVSLPHNAPHCNLLHHTATDCTTYCTALHYTAPHCTTLHHTAPHCTALLHSAPLCTTLHHSAPLCCTTHCTTTYHE